MAISANNRSQHETIGNCVNEVKKKQLNNIFKQCMENVECCIKF